LGAGGFRARGAEEGRFRSLFLFRAGVILCGKGEVRYEDPSVWTLAPRSEVRALAVPIFLPWCKSMRYLN